MRRHLCVLFSLAALTLVPFSTSANNVGDHSLRTTQYKILTPITQGNLTIFPVVAASTHDTSNFLTLDEGLRSGDVIITEAGHVQGLVRRPGVRPTQMYSSGAQVNQLVLVNNSKRPLMLLAGEIVTGGKQDRIIGKDRIVPVGAEPVDLSVFCVEPGRWTERTASFGSAGDKVSDAFMAQPAVRANAMAAKNQQQVWDAVNDNNKKAREAIAISAPAAAGAMGGTTSYAQVMGNKEVQRQIDKVAVPVAQNYEHLMQELRDRNAVGVVVAVGGRIIWADVFASNELLRKYWPKLARSYAAEAMFQHAGGSKLDAGDAEKFLADVDGKHEIVDSEPAVYRHTEITGDGFKAFTLTSLLPKTGFDLHLAKMSQ